jgi:hypothetical protein
MPASSWRATELRLPNGIVAVDVVGSGQFARCAVVYVKEGVGHPITSLDQFARILADAQTDAARLAAADPVGFAYVVCLLSDRPHHVFPRDHMWPELEQHFSLRRAENEPRIADGKFQCVVYSQYMPMLKVSRLTVDLNTLRVTEEPLISAPWPPATTAV